MDDPQEVGLHTPREHDGHAQFVTREQAALEIVRGLDEQLHLVTFVLRAGHCRLHEQPRAFLFAQEAGLAGQDDEALGLRASASRCPAAPTRHAPRPRHTERPHPRQRLQ